MAEVKGKNLTIKFNEFVIETDNLEVYPNFYGQALDCPDNYLTEWHTRLNCKELPVYCACDNRDELFEELKELYEQ